MTPPNTQQPKAFKKDEDHEQQEQPTLEVEDIVDSTGKLINQQPAYDQIINAEVQLQLGEEMVTGKVVQRTIGPDGQVVGTYDNNPFLNSIIYDVEFPDGQVKEYAANITAKKRSSGQKRGSGQISSVMDTSPATTKKPSIGKTGAHLCYYNTGEYRNISNEQKEELKEWRTNNPYTFKAGSKKAKKVVPKKPKSSMKKQVASLVEAALNKSVKFNDQVNDEEKYIMSMVQAAVTKTLNQKSDQQSQDKPKVSLKSILNHVEITGFSQLLPLFFTCLRIDLRETLGLS